MMQAYLTDLVRLSVTAPQKAARQVIGLGLGLDALLTLLALTTIANTVLFFVSLLLAPPEGPLPALFANPLIYAAVMAAGVLAFTVLMVRIGARMGGTGTLRDLLAVTVWLQCLRVLAQVVLLAAMVISAPIAVLLTLVVSIFGLWLFISFLQAAHGFDTPVRALVTAGLAVLALSFGLALLLTLTGVAPPQPI